MIRAADFARRDAASLWFLGALMLPIAAAFSLRYALPGRTDRLVDIGQLSNYSHAGFAGYALGMAGSFALYLAALRHCRRLPVGSALPAVFVVGACLTVTFAFMYPVNAIDPFIYVARSRVLTAHGANPQTTAPAAFPDDPAMALASPEWAVAVSPYGPLWNSIAAPITLLAGNNEGVALAGFKALAALATLTGGWSIVLVTRERAPKQAATAALAYLWNPLVLWEGVGNGHNDVVLALALLLAMLAWARRRDAAAIGWLSAATAIKYVALPLGPPALAALWRRGGSNRIRALVVAVACAVLVGIVSLAPFFDLPGVIASARAQSDIALTSPAAIAIAWLEGPLGLDAARSAMRATSAVLLGIGVIVGTAAAWRAPDRFPRIAFETMSLLLVVAVWNFRPWYLIWPLALAAVLPPGWPLRRAIAWTAGGAAFYGVTIWVWTWSDATWAVIQPMATLVVFAPMLLVSLIAVIAEARGAARRPVH
ncbi:MAG: DUF2029 domain-containing protein [Thermomicrobiales bacterium]|nr:DUF2029 domain-containing protein [Thermomicrobiales bacterium]